MRIKVNFYLSNQNFQNNFCVNNFTYNKNIMFHVRYNRTEGVQKWRFLSLSSWQLFFTQMFLFCFQQKTNYSYNVKIFRIFFIETVVRQMFQSLISGKFLWKDFVWRRNHKFHFVEISSSVFVRKWSNAFFKNWIAPSVKQTF